MVKGGDDGSHVWANFLTLPAGVPFAPLLLLLTVVHSPPSSSSSSVQLSLGESHQFPASRGGGGGDETHLPVDSVPGAVIDFVLLVTLPLAVVVVTLLTTSSFPSPSEGRLLRGLLRREGWFDSEGSVDGGFVCFFVVQRLQR